MPFIDIEGQKLHYVQQGKPNRQVCILIHGWSSTWFAVSPLMPMLAQRFNCMAIDLPGYGESPRLPQTTTIPAYAELVAKMIEQVSDGPVVLVGHSMGGMTSVTLALRYPVLVERMVLICPTLSGVLSTSINMTLAPFTFLERFFLTSWMVSIGEPLLNITDRLLRPTLFAARSGIAPDDYERIKEDTRKKGQGRVRNECFFAMRNNNLSGKLQTVQPPTMVIWGAEDNVVPLRDSGIVADEWHSADLRIIPKAGHWPQFETAETVRRYVASFLGVSLTQNESRVLDDREYAVTQEIADFLKSADVGHGLNSVQLLRLAGQFRQRIYEPGELVVQTGSTGTEMFLVQAGVIEVWIDPDVPAGQPPKNPRAIATLTPGQITGELAMLDGGSRSADLRAGPEGVTLLSLNREELLTLTNDDPELGSSLLWNLARALGLRVRFIQWQLQRATQRLAQSQKGQTVLVEGPVADSHTAKN